MNLLVTGGAGFIGANFVHYWLDHYSTDHIVNLDLLTYAGNLANLADVMENYPERYTFVRGDIGNVDLVEHLLHTYHIDVVVNFAGFQKTRMRMWLGDCKLVVGAHLALNPANTARRIAKQLRFIRTRDAPR